MNFVIVRTDLPPRAWHARCTINQSVRDGFPMPPEYLSAMSFLAAMLVAMVVSCIAAARGVRASQEILAQGRCAEGRVLGVWRPPVAGSFARIYFEFEPAGVGAAVRCCHIDRRPLDMQLAPLPAVGASVRVSYLPEQPTRAVIARLVPRPAR